MMKSIYNIYLWYYYNEVKCCYCGNKLYIDKKYYDPNFKNYSCNMACSYGYMNKYNITKNITNTIDNHSI